MTPSLDTSGSKQHVALSTRSLLIRFTLVDLLAGFLYWLYTLGILESRFFRLSRDLGFAESVQYVKFGFMIHILVRWMRREPQPLLRAWIILFSVMVADDSLGIHETVGGWIEPWIAGYVPGSLRPKDVAELFVFAALEGSCLLYVGWCFLKYPGPLRAESVYFALGLAPLVFCGLVLDLAHAPLMEQSGEMASMSVLLGVVHWRYRRTVG